MGDPRNSEEIRRLRSLLQRMADLADHVEQTGSFEKGAKNSIHRYNAIVERLEEMSAIPENTFPQLEEDTDFGELGAECTLLADYLKDMEDPKEDTKAAKRDVDLDHIVGLAPFLDRQDVRKMVLAHLPKSGSANPELIIALAPFIGREELGKIIREHMPEWFEGPNRPSPPTSPSPPRPPEPPQPTPTAGSFEWLNNAFGGSSPAPADAPRETDVTQTEPEDPRAEATALEDRLADVAERLRTAAEQLRRGDLTDERRLELAEQLAALGQQQARLASQQTALHRAEFRRPE